jgi:hypothetical protein
LCLAAPGSLYGPTSCWMLPFCDDSFSSSRASPQKLKHQAGRWIFRCFLFDRPGVLPAVAEGSLQPRCPGWLRRLGVKSKDQPTCSEGEATAESKTIRSSNVCDEGQSPAAGICTFSALLESECSLFSSPKTKPNRRLEPPPFSDLPAATCATNAVPNTLSGRLAARSRAAVAASNRPISILFQRLR